MGNIFEISPARERFVQGCANLIQAHKGAVLFIDYGHAQSGLGDTVQAVKDHQYVDIFDEVGQADITSHVDFEPLVNIAQKTGIRVSPIIPQNTFLYALGIDARAKSLLKTANTQQAEGIKSALHRLTAPDQMGTLFKVMEMFA